MALPTAEAFKSELMNLSPTSDPVSGITAFVGKVSAFMNQVQAGPTGQPGIFMFNDAAMIALLSAMPPVSDSSWTSGFASAWEAGVLTGIITPGTVIDPTWLGSGGLDTLTLPAAAATITTIPVAKATLLAGLNAMDPNDPDAPLPMAKAIRDATLQFTFLCIGLGPPIAFPPIPIPFSAQ